MPRREPARRREVVKASQPAGQSVASQPVGLITKLTLIWYPFPTVSFSEWVNDHTSEVTVSPKAWGDIVLKGVRERLRVCRSRDQPSGRDGISVVRATPVPLVVNSRSCRCLLNARDKISNLPLLAESSQRSCSFELFHGTPVCCLAWVVSSNIDLSNLPFLSDSELKVSCFEL